MDPITLIVAALVAGATSGALDEVKDGAKAGIKAAYEKLRGLARKKVAGDAGAAAALAEIETDPDTWEAPLKAKLTKLDAGSDAVLVAAARELLDLTDPAGAKAGKYNVMIANSQGVQIGDGGFQINNF
jgi:RIP homotypic interaction motif